MEEDYISMANNINDFITKYCGLNENNSNISEGLDKDETTSVADVLTDLIHMDKDNTTQEGGVAIDDVLQNLTGGDANAKNTNNKQHKEQDIVKIIPKELNVNLLEGGNNTNEENEQNEQKGGGSDGTKIEKDEDKGFNGDEDEDETFSNDEDEENIDDGTSSASTHDEYDEFVKHYNDTPKNTNMYGGDANNKRPNKIQIIPMFPYLLRY